MRKHVNNIVYRSAIGLAIVATFSLDWLSLGVAIIGKDGDPANFMYFGVLAVEIIGVMIARLRPDGMARALFATPFAQALVAAIALSFGLGLPWSGTAEIVLLNGFFVMLFAGLGLAIPACCACLTSARELINTGSIPYFLRHGLTQ